MNFYEHTIIARQDMGASQLKQIQEKYTNLVTKNEGKVLAFCGDLREKLTINNLLAATMDTFGSVDILINASRQVLTSDPLNPKDDTFNELIHQNVIVNFVVCHFFFDFFGSTSTKKNVR